MYRGILLLTSRSLVFYIPDISSTPQDFVKRENLTFLAVSIEAQKTVGIRANVQVHYFLHL